MNKNLVETTHHQTFESLRQEGLPVAEKRMSRLEKEIKRSIE
jgi:hypothetical protein